MLKSGREPLKAFQHRGSPNPLGRTQNQNPHGSEPVSILKKFVADAHKDESFQGYPVLPNQCGMAADT